MNKQLKSNHRRIIKHSTARNAAPNDITEIRISLISVYPLYASHVAGWEYSALHIAVAERSWIMEDTLFEYSSFELTVVVELRRLTFEEDTVIQYAIDKSKSHQIALFKVTFIQITVFTASVLDNQVAAYGSDRHLIERTVQKPGDATHFA